MSWAGSNGSETNGRASGRRPEDSACCEDARRRGDGIRVIAVGTDAPGTFLLGHGSCRSANRSRPWVEMPGFERR